MKTFILDLDGTILNEGKPVHNIISGLYRRIQKQQVEICRAS